MKKLPVLVVLVLFSTLVLPVAARADTPYLEYKWVNKGFYAGTSIYKRYQTARFKYYWDRGPVTPRDTSAVHTIIKITKSGVVKKTWNINPSGNTWHSISFKCRWKKGRYMLKVWGTDVDGHNDAPHPYRMPFLII